MIMRESFIISQYKIDVYSVRSIKPNQYFEINVLFEHKSGHLHNDPHFFEKMPVVFGIALSKFLIHECCQSLYAQIMMSAVVVK